MGCGRGSVNGWKGCIKRNRPGGRDGRGEGKGKMRGERGKERGGRRGMKGSTLERGRRVGNKNRVFWKGIRYWDVI